MSDSEDSGPGRREVAHRLFAAEFEDSEFSYSESDEERAPNYVVTPTGARVNRLFVVGVLTELEQVNDEVLRARIVDPTGAFVVYAGQYQPEALAFLEAATPPQFVAVTGKARTFEPEDSDRVFTSIRPESISEVDAETRDRWVVQAADQTVDRVGRLASAKQSALVGDGLRAALTGAGVDEGDAAGATLALEYYDPTGDYLEAVRDLALDAARVVAGERDEAGGLSLSPSDGSDDPLAVLASMDLEAAATSDADEADTADAAADAATDEQPADAPTDEETAAVTADDSSSDTTESAAPTADATDSADAAETDATADAEPSTASTESEPSSADATRESSSTEAETKPSTASTGAGPSEETGAEAPSEPSPSAGGPETGDASTDAEKATSSQGADEGSSGTLGDFDSGGDGGVGDSETTETDDDVGDFDTEFELDEQEREEIEQEYGTDFQSGTEVEEPGAADIETPDPEELAEAEAMDRDETADAEAGAEAATEETAAVEGDSDGEPAADVDLEDAVMAVMTDLNDGSGADREAVLTEVVEEYGADREAVEDAIQDALMGGRCYEPEDGKLTPI